MAETESLVLDAKQVASLLRVNVKTVYDCVARKKIPGAFWVGRLLRFREATVRQWLSEEPSATQKATAR